MERSPESFRPEESAASPDIRQQNVGEMTPEMDDQAAYWLEMIAQEEAEAREKTKAPEEEEKERAALELNQLFEEWLVPEKLEPLHAITDEQEARTSPERAAAKDVLAEILKRTRLLAEFMTREELEPLMEKHRVLSRAVGMINSGVVDHTR